MLVNRVVFIAITFAIMITLLIFGLSYITAGVSTFVIVMVGYIIISYIRSKKRLAFLEDDCDPQGFLEQTEKQMAITGKNPKMSAYLNIDKAAGLITMGEFDKAKSLLLSIDKDRLSVKNGTLLVYTINLITCHYELGEIHEGEELFETQIPVLPPVNSNMTLAVRLLVAERLFFLGRYEESEKQFKELLGNKISRRVSVSILFRLAQMDDKKGDTAAALEKYKQAASKGNKLWIAEQARKYIAQYE